MPYKTWLLNHAERYVGVDWGSTLHKLKADILVDLNKPLLIDSEVADTVISLPVMEYLCEPQQFLNEAHRILKHGQLSINTAYSRPLVGSSIYSHSHAFDSGCRSAGCAMVRQLLEM